MTARGNVMLHSVGWGGHHITRAQNGGEFLQNQGFSVLRWNGNKRLNNWRNVGQKQFGGGWGHRRTSKQSLAGLWSNSNSELSQEINAQNGMRLAKILL
jgi:hypothetical protein